jgi:hypothetical protein
MLHYKVIIIGLYQCDTKRPCRCENPIWEQSEDEISDLSEFHRSCNDPELSSEEPLSDENSDDGGDDSGAESDTESIRDSTSSESEDGMLSESNSLEPFTHYIYIRYR